MKLAFYSLKYDIRQIHMPYLADNNGGMGDFDKLGKFISVEEGSKNLKNSSKALNILKKINLGKFVYDKERTERLIQNLPKLTTGIALKRKFPKEKNDKYSNKILYSVWVYSEDEELTKNLTVTLNIPNDLLEIDWEGNEKTKRKKLLITNTPIILIGDSSSSDDDDDDDSNGFVIFLEVLGVLLLIALIAGIAFYAYKRYLAKKNLNVDEENLNEGLTKD